MKSPSHLVVSLLATCLTCFGVSLSHAQTDGAEPSKAVKEATKLAERHQYAEAVRVLELAMVEGDTSEVLLMDLAGYYIKTGNLRMATALCKPLVDKDRPRPWHLLEVASMLVDQGRFTEAEPYLQRFEEMKPQDLRAGQLRRRAAQRRTISPLYPSARLDTFLHNTLADDGFPFRDGQTLYWSSDREGAKRTSGWTGRPMVGMYEARDELDGDYGPANRIAAKWNRGVTNTASPWLTENGDTLYFTANAERPNRRGELNMQLFYAVRESAGEWGQCVHIGSQPDQPSCLHPSVSPDGQWLYFAANASDSRGGLDLYRMPRLPDGTWGRPDNLGSTVNSERNDGFPVAAADGKLYFASQGHNGFGGFDLFVVEELPGGKWSTPRNLGEPVNSSADETGWLPVRSSYALLVSNRVGGDDDIYEVRY